MCYQFVPREGGHPRAPQPFLGLPAETGHAWDPHDGTPGIETWQVKIIRLVVPAVADQDYLSDSHGAEQPGRRQTWAECGAAVPGSTLATWAQGPGVSAPPGLRAWVCHTLRKQHQKTTEKYPFKSLLVSCHKLWKPEPVPNNTFKVQRGKSCQLKFL